MNQGLPKELADLGNREREEVSTSLPEDSLLL